MTEFSAKHSEQYHRFDATNVDIEVTVYVSRVDGAVVVEIDTPYENKLRDNQDGPTPLRIYLNDAVLYENPAFPEEEGG